MNARTILMSLLIATPLYASAARAEAPLVVAVFDVHVSGAGLSEAEADLLSDAMCETLERDKVFRVVPPKKLKRTLLDQLKKKVTDCLDKLCRLGLSHEVGADLMLLTRVSRIGRQCVISGTIWDVPRSVSSQSATARGACSRGGLLLALKQVANKLREERRRHEAHKKKAQPAP